MSESLAKRLAYVCAHSGGADALAEASGMEVSRISDMMMERYPMTVEDLVQLSMVSGINLEWLATGEGSPEERRERVESVSPLNKEALEASIRDVIASVTHRHQSLDNVPPEELATLITTLYRVSAEDWNSDKNEASGKRHTSAS